MLRTAPGSMSKHNEEIKESVKDLAPMIDGLEETKNLYFNNSLKDPNYVTRDKLLYKPLIKLQVPKPRHNLVYYWKQYSPFKEKASYGWSNLFKPIIAKRLLRMARLMWCGLARVYAMPSRKTIFIKKRFAC